MSKHNYTVQALAADNELWMEYVDADNVADFDAMTRDEREEMIRTIWPDTREDEEILARRQAAAVLGSRGGSVTSPDKANAARENGKRGGRPRKDTP